MVTGGTKYDAIVIGAGHNGLVAAARLARTHGRVLVLEAGDRLGGAAATSEIVPDYRAPAVAHLLEGFPRRIERELKLARHGLRYAARDVPTVALDRDGDHIALPRNRREYA
ncbi:MAG: NAD(P)-binding protein, partial [Parvibaculaceae bacterium]